MNVNTRITPVIVALTPALAFAQLSNVENLMTALGRIVDLALPIVVAIALLAFFWGLVKFIFAQGNEEAKGEGKKIMIWGLIALFVMVAVWGLVQFIADALEITPGGSIPLPTVEGVN